MSKGPEPIDSRRWTGDIDDTPKPALVPALPSRFVGPVLVVLMASGLMFAASSLIWVASGSPMVVAPPMKVATLKFPLLAAFGTLFLLRSRPRQAFVWTTIVFSFSLFLAYQFGYLHDLNTPRTEKQATYFVENISRPGYGGRRESRIFPELRLSTERGTYISIPTTRAFAKRLTSGDSCLKAKVSRGRYGFAFIEPIILSAGDGTGSFLVAAVNRKRCFSL
ncbi:hypothetical protein DFR51_1657 [Sphingosinicella microcystinivorans]|nr:hypothetical protein DFR51_1657 [Sphingosinicella microcystinivorans]